MLDLTADAIFKKKKKKEKKNRKIKMLAMIMKKGSSLADWVSAMIGDPGFVRRVYCEAILAKPHNSRAGGGDPPPMKGR